MTALLVTGPLLALAKPGSFWTDAGNASNAEAPQAASDAPKPQHINWAMVALLADGDGNRISDALDRKAVETPDATVFLHVLYDRRPTADDADLLRSAFSATRTYVFNNWDWIKVETLAAHVAAFLDAPGVIGIEEFVPPIIQNTQAAWTTRVRQTTAATSDGFDHRLAVHETLGFRGEGMIVAILDTGVDNKHPMLDDLDDNPTTFDPKLVMKEDPETGAILIGGADASDGFVVIGCVDPVDDHLHGTHVAGTAVGTDGRDVLVASNRGVAPQARMVDIDIAVPIGHGAVGGLVEPVGSAIGLGEDIAFDWLIDYNNGKTCFGDPGPFKVDVASMSFGAGGSAPSISQNVGISDVVRAGITFTLAAGNSGPGANTLGGGAEGAIIVAASDDRNTAGREDDYLAGFSSRGPRPSDGDADTLDELRPDITAPGVGINSAFHHGQGVLGLTASGTSMATPHVAGVAALMIQAARAEGKDISPKDHTGDWRDMGRAGAVPIRDLIQKTAEYRTEVEPTFAAIQQTATGKFGLPWNNGWGYGLIDAYGAVQAAIAYEPDPTRPVLSIGAPSEGQTFLVGNVDVSGTVRRPAGLPPSPPRLFFHTTEIATPVATLGTPAHAQASVASRWMSLSPPAERDAPAVFASHSLGDTLLRNPFIIRAQTGLASDTQLGDGNPGTTESFGVTACMTETTQTAFVPRVLIRVFDDATLVAQLLTNVLPIPTQLPQCINVFLPLGRRVDEQTPANNANLGIPFTPQGDYVAAAGSIWEVRIDVDTLFGGPAWQLFYDHPDFPSSFTYPAAPAPGEEGAERVDLFLDDSTTPADSRPVDTRSTSEPVPFDGTVPVPTPGQHTITARWYEATASGDLLVASGTVNVTAESRITPGVDITSPAQDGQTHTEVPVAFEGTYQTGPDEAPASAGTLGSPGTSSRLLANDPNADTVLALVQSIPGYLAAVPAIEGGTRTLVVALAGSVPANAPQGPVHGWKLRYVTQVEPQTAMGLADGPAVSVTPDQLVPLGYGPKNSPGGPNAPGPKNGIGPGSAIRMGKSTGTFICSASYLFQNPDTGIYYLSTAGHCLLIGSSSPPITGISNPGAVVLWVEICYLNCVSNGPAIGTYLRLNPSAGYHPVAFAHAQGVGSDFGLIEIPASANHLLRPWMSTWGGPMRYEAPRSNDLIVHYGHGSYCCPTIGSVATRSMVDQGRIATSPITNANDFNALGHITGGDSGSAAGTGQLQTGRTVLGRGGSGVITHTSTLAGVGIPILHATLLSRGQDVVQGLLGFRPALVLEDGKLELPPAVLSASITRPTDGALIDATGGPVTVEGNALFPAFQPTHTYYLHGARGAGNSCTTATYWMNTIRSGASESATGCGQLFTATGYALNPVLGPALDLRFPATPAPAQSLPFDADREIYAELYFGGFSGAPTALIDADVRLEYANGAQVAAAASVLQLPLTDGKARIVLEPLQAGIPAGADVRLRIIVYQASPAGVFFQYGGSSPSHVFIPLDLPIVEEVQVAIDDPTFAPESRLAVTGTTSWAAPWDATASGAGLHTIYARAFQNGQTSPIVQVSVEVEPIGPKPPRADFAHSADGLDVAFLDASTAGDAPLSSWSWDFGDGHSGAGTAPTHRYDAGGTYAVTLTVLDEAGFSSSKTRDVTVEAPSWEVVARVVDSGGTAMTGWASVAKPASEASGTWAFPWAPEPRPVDGAYTLETELRHRGSAIAHAARTILLETPPPPNEPPTARIAGPATGVVGAALTFDGTGSEDTDGTIVAYEWDFGDATTATGAQASHTYAAPGTYVVLLRVSDDDGASGSATHTIEVSAPPPTGQKPTAVIEGPSKKKEGHDVPLDGSASSDPDGQIVEYRWDMGDGTVRYGAKIKHAYDAPGDYTVTLTVKDNDGHTGTATHPVTIEPCKNNGKKCS